MHDLLEIIVNDFATRKFFRETQGVELPDGQPIPKILKYDRHELYRCIDEEISEMTSRVHKYQTAFNEIILDFLKADMLDVYKAGFIDMRKQYLTIGVNGLTDAAEFLGLTISPNEEYKEFVNTILETINISNRKDKTRDTMFNTEFVPGENLSGKNYKWDKKDGFFVSPEHNCRNTVCNDCGYISKDTLTVCPKCGSRNLDYLTRVIGYLKRVSSFSEMRQEEARHRFYAGEEGQC